MAELEVSKVTADDILIDPSTGKKKGPTPEELEEYKKEFLEKAQAFSLKQFQIGSEENAENIVNYLEHFIKHRFIWTKNAWMGTVRIAEELLVAKTSLSTTDNKSFKLGYQALEFAYFALENPSGLGLESAQMFEKENVEFGIVHESCGEALAKAREELKEIQFLQDRWAAAGMGFYYEIEPEVDASTGEIVNKSKYYADKVDKENQEKADEKF